MAPERAATEAEAMVPAFAAGRTIDPVTPDVNAPRLIGSYLG